MQVKFGIAQSGTERVELLKELSQYTKKCRFQLDYILKGEVLITVLEEIDEIITDDWFCAMLTGLDDEFLPGTMMIHKDLKCGTISIHDEVDSYVVYRSLCSVLSALFLNDDYFFMRGCFLEPDSRFITGLEKNNAEQILLINHENCEKHNMQFFSASINPLYSTGSYQRCDNITKLLKLFCEDFFLLDSYIVSQIEKSEQDYDFIKVLHHIKQNGVIVKAKSMSHLKELCSMGNSNV